MHFLPGAIQYVCAQHEMGMNCCLPMHIHALSACTGMWLIVTKHRSPQNCANMHMTF